MLSLQTDFTHDDVAVDGHFTSGVKLLNQIHALIDRAILRNLASVITDCPTREKLGWLEQTHLAGYSIMDNYGVLKLYEKVADDMGEAQLSDGFVPGIAPEYVAFVDAKGDSTNFRDSPEWGSASILAPWQAYQFYGDLEGSKVVWHLRIPAGSRATVVLPSAAAEISMNGGATPPASPKGEVLLGSGRYEFRFQVR